MTTTEQDKDTGIDEIMKMNIPADHKVHYIADLCKHRGKCMDADGIVIHQQNDLIQLQLREITRLKRLLEVRSPWDNLKIWLNGWARS